MKKYLVFMLMIILILQAFAFNHTSAEATSTVVDEKVWSALESKSTAQIIVTFDGEDKPTTQNISLLENLNITTAVTLNQLPIVGALATKAQVEQLAQDEEVKSIYLNERLTYFNADANEITGVNQVRADEQFTAQNGGLPVTGNGVGVVVNDSGVDGTHGDHTFKKNLVQNVLGTSYLSSTGIIPISYIENVINTDTNSGHGTHVAGTVGGTGTMSGGKYAGAAPEADLIGYGSGAALLVLDGIGGFDYAIEHQDEYNIQVITNSWGSSGEFDPHHPINVASKKAYDAGITVLFAAGNEGPSEDTHNPYAKAPWVISVGAGEKDGSLANFSSRGTKDVGGTFEIDGEQWEWKDEPTVVAPGVDIISTRVLSPLSVISAPKDLQLIEPTYLPFYTTMSGTSMATPHVAGIVALLLEANPALTPSEVKDILEQTATDMPGYESWEVGAGYVNAYDAVEAAFNQ
ncbi:S8 family serine peptidase [Alkalihalophilus lindianensis]|uniref:S8 family serine peptidase n=1 Tax=Alkalihalophilus lindianensis TaxID=1630542 RepID=A0ABU3X984_9BACI|nr:S8 family serine peptidase [Alkalihalophilus lindianensis]MDV2684443.1 S8 family serine peptidase [Alkalihalophilus lindianensis]